MWPPDAKLAPRGKAKVRAQAAWLCSHTLKHGAPTEECWGPSGSGGAGVHIQVRVALPSYRASSWVRGHQLPQLPSTVVLDP